MNCFTPLLDSGSLACTLSKHTELKIISGKMLSKPIPLTQEIMLVGCGETFSKPKCIYEVEMKLGGKGYIVPVLMVSGQCDDLIIGTNIIRFTN